MPSSKGSSQLVFLVASPLQADSSPVSHRVSPAHASVFSHVQLNSNCGLVIVIPILQMRKLSPREGTGSVPLSLEADKL